MTFPQLCVLTQICCFVSFLMSLTANINLATSSTCGMSHIFFVGLFNKGDLHREELKTMFLSSSQPTMYLNPCEISGALNQNVCGNL